MFFDASGDRKDIRIENNIFGRKTNLLNKQFVSTLTNFCFARKGIGLTFFVESHHDDRSPIATA